MKEYTLLFRGGMDYEQTSPEQLQADMMNWKTWIEQLAMAGKYSSGQRLDNKSIQISGADKQVSDGPFVEGKEIIGGFVVLKAADIEEAIALTRGCPIFDFGGTTEIREVVQ